MKVRVSRNVRRRGRRRRELDLGVRADLRLVKRSHAPGGSFNTTKYLNNFLRTVITMFNSPSFKNENGTGTLQPYYKER